MHRLTIVADVNASSGYGNHLIHMVRGLEKRGVYCSIRARTLNPNKVPADIISRIVKGPQPEEWELLLSPATEAVTPGKKVVYFTMYESSILPDDRIAKVDQAEAVIVPSEWCREVFVRSGVKRPVRIVPLGIDPSVYHYRPNSNQSATVFATAGMTANGRDRKGIDSVIRAFRAAFPYDRNVFLKVKCHRDCGLPEISDPRIMVNRDFMSDMQIAEWLATSDCFVSGATGEAWGLWQQQSMACGRPVMAAIYGGLREFMGNENSYPVRFREAAASEHWGGKWAIPGLGSMIEQMRYVRANRQEAVEVGRVAAQNVSHLTWENSCEMLFAALLDIGAFPKPRSPRLTHGRYLPERIPSVLEQAQDRKWGSVIIPVPVYGGEAVFNPSVVEIDGNLLWFARSSSTEGGNRDGSKIFAFREDDLSRRLPLSLPGLEGDWFEDPRASFDGEKIALSYTRARFGSFATQELAFLDKDMRVIDVWHPDLGRNGCSPMTATGPEKNWAWFKHNGDWHCIYWLEPMQVFRFQNGKVAEKFATSKFDSKWLHGERHGGTHPVRIGDEYFGFSHSRLPWFGRDRNRYFLSAYAFEAKPPFAMTRMSREPFFRSEDDLRFNPCSCVICGGALFDGAFWTLAIGARDEQCIKVEVLHDEILSGMTSV